MIPPGIILGLAGAAVGLIRSPLWQPQRRIDASGADWDARCAREASIASPFGIKSRRRARTISGKASLLPPKWGLQRSNFSGSIAVVQTLIFPGLAGTPARLTRRVSCFWVSFSE